MDEFEKVDREKKDPKAKPIFSALKKLQQVVYSRDKYDDLDDYKKDCYHYHDVVDAKLTIAENLDSEYETVADSILRLLNKASHYMK